MGVMSQGLIAILAPVSSAQRPELLDKQFERPGNVLLVVADLACRATRRPRL